MTLYLLQSLNIKLMPKLQKELKPGTRIVSQSFSMGECGRRTSRSKSTATTSTCGRLSRAVRL